MAFETDESVLFIEVSSIQRCPDRQERVTIDANMCIVCLNFLSHLLQLYSDTYVHVHACRLHYVYVHIHTYIHVDIIDG